VSCTEYSQTMPLEQRLQVPVPVDWNDDSVEEEQEGTKKEIDKC
jgi:hypothetical protein